LFATAIKENEMDDQMDDEAAKALEGLLAREANPRFRAALRKALDALKRERRPRPMQR
jgi:hypothetical protein